MLRAVYILFWLRLLQLLQDYSSHRYVSVYEAHRDHQHFKITRAVCAVTLWHVLQSVMLSGGRVDVKESLREVLVKRDVIENQLDGLFSEALAIDGVRLKIQC